MRLTEYLKERGGNALTNAECASIGVKEMSNGWPHRYAENEIPPKLAEAVLLCKGMTKIERKNFLKNTARGQTTRSETKLEELERRIAALEHFLVV